MSQPEERYAFSGVPSRDEFVSVDGRECGVGGLRFRRCSDVVFSRQSNYGHALVTLDGLPE